ncbi:hypothetical protein G5C51_04535 [Streptomyces sp. A7024]|uniref:TniQ domain-containing protein n=1 Tax=Streptomyces coryli TaxID=1128680 RepID=A0A6G4TT63_9ACTN|nr:hypothetical protein [Streptomyces coryli]
MIPHRQLPCTARPFHDETVNSYLARLAAANHLRIEELREHLGVRMLKKTPMGKLLEPLSTLSGYPVHNLRLAMPEFITEQYTDEPGCIERPATSRHRALKRPACRRCTRAMGITEPVTCWTTHDRNVCLRHRLWIGEGCHRIDDQADLRRLPRVCRAQRHHRNLLVRHGRRWVRERFHEARSIYLQWHKEREFQPQHEIVRRMLNLAAANRRPIRKDLLLPVIFHAEIVALTGLLASRHWEQRLYLGEGSPQRYVEEITRREILAGYQLTEEDDPLFDWIKGRVIQHKFCRVHWRAWGALDPDETTRPTPPNRPSRDFRTSPWPFY